MAEFWVCFPVGRMPTQGSTRQGFLLRSTSFVGHAASLGYITQPFQGWCGAGRSGGRKVFQQESAKCLESRTGDNLPQPSAIHDWHLFFKCVVAGFCKVGCRTVFNCSWWHINLWYYIFRFDRFCIPPPSLPGLLKLLHALFGLGALLLGEPGCQGIGSFRSGGIALRGGQEIPLHGFHQIHRRAGA